MDKNPLSFHTDFIYTDRETKARYVYLKFGHVLRGSILDVGADKCHLKHYLGKDVSYMGIGFGGSLDMKVDLEKEKIPFDDESFDCLQKKQKGLSSIVPQKIICVSYKWILIVLATKGLA